MTMILVHHNTHAIIINTVKRKILCCIENTFIHVIGHIYFYMTFNETCLCICNSEYFHWKIINNPCEVDYINWQKGVRNICTFINTSSVISCKFNNRTFLIKVCDMNSVLNVKINTTLLWDSATCCTTVNWKMATSNKIVQAHTVHLTVFTVQLLNTCTTDIYTCVA